MSNESQNFPTAAVISDRQATGGHDSATSSASKLQANYRQVNHASKVLGSPSSVVEEGGHLSATQPGKNQSSTPGISESRSLAEGGLPASFGLSAAQLRLGRPSASGWPSVSYELSGCAHDPYEWFDEHGQCLHSVSIGFLRNARSNGVRYTGEFNIEGFIYTVGSPSIEGLYTEALAKRIRHLQSIDRHQARKRTRCALRFMERYPEAELPLWLASSEN